MTAHEHIAFLAGSPNRVRVLRAIHEDPARQCALVDRLALSRSTVQRCLGGFTERGWARKEDGAFRITAGGIHVLSQYDALTDTIDAVAEHGGLLDHLRDLAFSLPAEAIATATVVSASTDRPHAPESHIVDALETTGVERLRAITPTVSDMFNEAAALQVAAGVDIELILDSSGFDVSRREFPDALDDAYTAETLDLYVHPGEFGFGLLIVDNRVLVSVYDDEDRIRGCLDGTGSPIVEWADDVHHDRRQAATRAEERSA